MIRDPSGNRVKPIAHFDETCLYCGFPLNERGQVDHIIPRSRGGPNLPFNKAMTHALCNHLKSSLLPSEHLTFPSPRVLKCEQRAIRKMKKMGLEVVDHFDWKAEERDKKELRKLLRGDHSLIEQILQSRRKRHIKPCT